MMQIILKLKITKELVELITMGVIMTAMVKMIKQTVTMLMKKIVMKMVMTKTMSQAEISVNSMVYL